MTPKELTTELEALQKEVRENRILVHPDEKEREIAELEQQMQKPDFWKNNERAQSVSQRHAHLRAELSLWEKLEKEVSDLLALAHEAGDDAVLAVDIEKQTAELRARFARMSVTLLLNGPHDERNAIIAIHAGAGGTEAQDWVGMLYRMLMRYCERRGWKTMVVDEHEGAEAGYKSVMFEVQGASAYGYVKSENGVHRLVRISPFDAEKMRHTSFAMVEVLPELDDAADIKIDEKDLQIDTFRSGGKGGQNVNKVETAVRITHVPSGIVVSCQTQRSQLQNRESAMKVLRAKLYAAEQEKKAKEKAEVRGEFQSAEWGSQIRSYVLHPYQMVKDHRTDYETQDTAGVLDGDLDAFTEAYLRWKKE
ncbi:MAG: peptide chain release factor 2 [Candidatus Magasanikbacteria bacterium]|nr:peptide chain release factor 2 [Candidatus Magasanikbacteria bacterium]